MSDDISRLDGVLRDLTDFDVGLPKLAIDLPEGHRLTTLVTQLNKCGNEAAQSTIAFPVAADVGPQWAAAFSRAHETMNVAAANNILTRVVIMWCREKRDSRPPERLSGQMFDSIHTTVILDSLASAGELSLLYTVLNPTVSTEKPPKRESSEGKPLDVDETILPDPPSPPQEAPERWESWFRDGIHNETGETAIEFVARVYRDWLVDVRVPGITIALLAGAEQLDGIDKPLAEALLAHIARSETNASYDRLPTPRWADGQRLGLGFEEFIRRFLKPYLRTDGSGLIRPDLKVLDPDIYAAMNRFIRRQTLPADCPIPTKTEALDAVIRNSTTPSNSRDAQRITSALRRRESIVKENDH